MSQRIPIVVPELGLDAVAMSLWFVELGDPITQGERVAELLADGVTFDIAAPATGILVDTHADEEDPVTTGQVIGMIEETNGEL